MNRIKSIVPGVCCGLLLAACSQVPPLWHATNNLPFSTEISIRDVVERVKCELADAVDHKMEDKRFAWLESWTVKADLTLQANESGSLSPSATFVQPLQNAYFLGAGPSSAAFPSGTPGNSVGATAQNFNLGFGANYSSQVFRTETVSFTMSLRELKAWREWGPGRLHECLPVGSTDLQGNLDLGPWIDAALEPVAHHDLNLGIHPSPGAGGKAASAGGARTEGTNAPDSDLAYYTDYAKNSETDAVKSAQQANATARQARTTRFLDTRVQARIASFALEASNAAKYSHQAWEKLTNSGKDLSHQDIVALATNAAENSEAAARYASAAKLLANPDPPIDSLSHAVNFIVTIGAGLSPNWALLHWKGPTTLGNLVSASAVRTHTLNIAMGSPSSAPSTDVERLLNNQAFRQAVQSP
ncbi:hypothetical protein [Bradyrhizobium sp. UFLA05-112]